MDRSMVATKYRAALPLSRTTLTYLSGVICRHRGKIGTPLPPSPALSRPDGTIGDCHDVGITLGAIIPGGSHTEAA
jgi:hypothetical protein